MPPLDAEERNSILQLRGLVNTIRSRDRRLYDEYVTRGRSASWKWQLHDRVVRSLPFEEIGLTSDFRD